MQYSDTFFNLIFLKFSLIRSLRHILNLNKKIISFFALFQLVTQKRKTEERNYKIDPNAYLLNILCFIFFTIHKVDSIWLLPLLMCVVCFDPRGTLCHSFLFFVFFFFSFMCCEFLQKDMQKIIEILCQQCFLSSS